MCGTKYNAHMEPLLKGCNILKIEDIFKLSCLKLYHNIYRKRYTVHEMNNLTHIDNKIVTDGDEYMVTVYGDICTYEFKIATKFNDAPMCH